MNAKQLAKILRDYAEDVEAGEYGERKIDPEDFDTLLGAIRCHVETFVQDVETSP